MHPGQGPGLCRHDLGETGGSDSVTLLESEMPAHTHPLQATPQPGEDPAPGPQEALARSTGREPLPEQHDPELVPLAPSAVGPAGGGLPHNNLQPYLSVIFCIALQGVYPPRS